jgi:hypothetical protein
MLVVEALRFQVSKGKTRASSSLKRFFTGMALFFPYMMVYLYYESNGGSILHGFCVFLEFSTEYQCCVMVFFVITMESWRFRRKVTSVVVCKYCALVIDLREWKSSWGLLWFSMKIMSIVEQVLSFIRAGVLPPLCVSIVSTPFSSHSLF